MSNEYVYGPVRSRRLGASLGVDIVPLKKCSYNCIYCQLGSGFSPLVERKVYAPPDEVCRQIAERLKAVPAPDYITLGGSGEPTLNSALGKIASAVRRNHGIPLCLLTNGSLMWMDEVRHACSAMDLIIPSLDAGDPETFQVVNRPHPSILFEKVVRGLEQLREEFSGLIWLEIFLIPGINDSERSCEAFKALSERLRPDRIHLNTAVRPPADPSVKPLDHGRLLQISRFLGPNAEVITPAPETRHRQGSVGTEEIVAILQRRPCTAAEIADACAASVTAVRKTLDRLAADGRVRLTERNGENYYSR